MLIFDTETAAEAWLADELAPHVDVLARHVAVRHPLHAALLYIDILASITGFRPGWTTPALIGLEIKRPDGSFGTWSEAAHQAGDYLVSGILKAFGGFEPMQRPMWMFVWPDPRDTDRSLEMERRMWGAERLAGRGNVGTVRTPTDGGLEFWMSANPLFSTTRGAHGQASQSTRLQLGARGNGTRLVVPQS